MVLYFQLSQANRKKDYITSMLRLTQLPQSKCPWLLNWHSHIVTPLTARQKVRNISIEAPLLSSITLIPGGSWGTGCVNNLMEPEYQHPAVCVLDRGAECNSGQGKREVITVGKRWFLPISAPEWAHHLSQQHFLLCKWQRGQTTVLFISEPLFIGEMRTKYY